MRKSLISICATLSLLTAGCSTFDDIGDSVDSAANVIPEALDSAGLIYRPTIIQGNIVTQEQVNGLKPGMSRRQVRFVLGSPTLRDVFHDDRWDYPYTEGVGSTPDEYKYLSIYFEGDKLVRVTGDLHPQPESQQETKPKASVVTVPDYEGYESKDDEKSWWQKTKSWIVD